MPDPVTILVLILSLRVIPQFDILFNPRTSLKQYAVA